MKELKKAAPKKEIAQTQVTQSNDLGAIQISDSVISSLVKKAALSVDGVSRLASNFVDNIAEIVGSKTSSRSINIITEDDKVEVVIKINIKFGFKIPQVAAQVQSVIIEDVESVTGMNVSKVNVIVQEIEDPQEEIEEEESTDDNQVIRNIDK
ncbi:MAG: Asp23/Gls24 family envelope stress response protein [Victivallaceae bacterium]|nr:Asp23/Gls24 family envelope stress response protein [Victivallaceae bacterium]MDD4317855.1 Asp23/Gls24 family envelope stress response protein [Victivallaceae bacterium]